MNIADPLSCNSQRDNVYANVLSHDSLECRDVKLRALLAMICSMLSSKAMDVDNSKGVPIAPTNEVCSGDECVNE